MSGRPLQNFYRLYSRKVLLSSYQGTEDQRANIMKLLIERLEHLDSMGKSSE